MNKNIERIEGKCRKRDKKDIKREKEGKEIR